MRSLRAMFASETPTKLLRWPQWAQSRRNLGALTVSIPGTSRTSRSGPLIAGGELALLRERLGTNLLAGGWIKGSHFGEACAAIYLEGELVHLEDLVLRDAHMDVRTASHGAARIMAVLRARRLAAQREGRWLLTSSGIGTLSGGRSAPAKPRRERLGLVYEINWDAEERLDERRAVLTQTEEMPVLVGAAIAFDA